MCQPDESRRVGWIEVWEQPDGTFSSEVYTPGLDCVAQAAFEHSDVYVSAEGAAIELGQIIENEWEGAA